jgi:hypothetical protein
MLRITAALAALPVFLICSTPAHAGRTIVTTIDMETFAARCAAAGGAIATAAEGSGQDCTLPSGAALRCAPEAVGGLVCQVLIERRGKGITAASIAAMPDGSYAPRLIARAD